MRKMIHLCLLPALQHRQRQGRLQYRQPGAGQRSLAWPWNKEKCPWNCYSSSCQGGETTAQHAQGNSIPVCIHHLLQLVIENKLGVPVQRRNFSDSVALLNPAVRTAHSCSQGVQPARDRWAWPPPILVLSWFLVIRTFFSSNQKPKDTIQSSCCCSAVSKEAEHERFLPLFTKTISAQAGSTGGCFFVINQNLVLSCFQTGKSGTKTV